MLSVSGVVHSQEDQQQEGLARPPSGGRVPLPANCELPRKGGSPHSLHTGWGGREQEANLKGVPLSRSVGLNPGSQQCSSYLLPRMGLSGGAAKTAGTLLGCFGGAQGWDPELWAVDPFFGRSGGPQLSALVSNLLEKGKRPQVPLQVPTLDSSLDTEETPPAWCGKETTAQESFKAASGSYRARCPDQLGVHLRSRASAPAKLHH